MQTAGPSSSKSRFDPRRLLSEIQSSAPPLRGHDTSDDDDDKDFMSDKYLLTTEPKQRLTYTDKRRQLEAHFSTKSKGASLKQREEEAREEGLDRDLLAEAEIVAGGGKLPEEEGGKRRWDLLEKEGKGEEANGTTKAMKMMLAMGYRRGEALGRRMTAATESAEEEEDEDEDGDVRSPPDTPPTLTTDEQFSLQTDLTTSQDREEDEYLTGGVSASTSAKRSTEPLRPDQRWLGINKRAGIGSILTPPAEVSRAIHAASNKPSTTTNAESDFLTRLANQQAQRHTSHLLSRARKTLISLDHALQYNPLWLDPDLYRQLSGNTSSIDSIDTKMRSDPSFSQAVELLQLAFGQEETKEEAKMFVELDTKTQLELTLDRLRTVHRYCLFCGCQYDNVMELERLCPGTTEQDHD